mgnify:FL=1
MNPTLKASLWKQFGASIDMLENAIKHCPDELWDTPSLFWYFSYHTLFWLDHYLTLEPETFAPPAPFTLSEFESATMPERVYKKEELLTYLEYCRTKCHSLIASLTDETANQLWKNEYRSFTIFELLLYNMRHVQHHAAQLNLLLRQGINDAPRWVSQTKKTLES